MRAIVLCLLIPALGSNLGIVLADTGRQIIETSGVKGGLVVHVGCGDGRLTAELRMDERFTVQGLAQDDTALSQARTYIDSRRLYGKVSVDRLVGKRLPYIDNMVNLLVVEEPDIVPAEELVRVLVPDGVALVRQETGWQQITKPRPAEMDSWPHFLHGADGNAVANDTLVDFPFHLQWAGGPRYARSHDGISTVNVVVSDGKRVFYIADDSTVALPDQIPAEWSLIARDAFNGVPLWQRPLARWQARSSHSRHDFPQDLVRRLVAGDQNLYVTMSIFGPVSALDPSSGETVRTYDRTQGAEEILYEDGILYLVVNPAPPEQIDRGVLARMLPATSPKRLMAIAAESGRILWTKDDADTVGLVQMSTTVKDDRLVFKNSKELVCLNADNGELIWRTGTQRPGLRSVWGTPAIVIAHGVVLCADRQAGGSNLPDRIKQPLDEKTETSLYQALKKEKSVSSELVAYDLGSGKELWSIPSAEGSHISNELFVVEGIVWAGESANRSSQDYRLGRDIRTGEVKVTIPASDNWVGYHHHRCYRDKATARFVLAGRTGVEFIDLDSGRLTPHHWIRGICKFGILPCNGLLYIPPKQCSCYQESMLTGFNALAPEPKPRQEVQVSLSAKRQKGPAYGFTATALAARKTERDWPTYRCDKARSGATTVPIAGPLKQSWKTVIEGRLSAPVIAGEQVYVAAVDRHTLYALDVESGKKNWCYTAGGRLDSPPTVHNGRVVFGSRDGWVYALRAEDGALIWRYRAAPGEQQLMAHGQCESVWPVHGSVLIDNQHVYFAAGRNSHLDGGVVCTILDLNTGKRITQRRHYSRQGRDGTEKALYPAFPGAMLPDRELPGVLPDVPSSDGEFIFMRGVAFNRNFEPAGKYVQHLYSAAGFLDDAWYKRLFWFYGNHQFSGLAGRGFNQGRPSSARLLVTDSRAVYAYKDYSLHDEGLFAIKKSADLGIFDSQFPPRKQDWKNVKKEMQKQAAAASFLWQQPVPFYVRAMVATADNLLLAGPPKHKPELAAETIETNAVDLNPPPQPLRIALESWRGLHGGKLWIVSKNDGRKQAGYELAAPPVHDGMAVARASVFISAMDGTVQCLKSGS